MRVALFLAASFLVGGLLRADGLDSSQGHDKADATTPAPTPETCRERACQDIVASLLEFIVKTHQIYNPEQDSAKIEALPVPEVYFVSRPKLVRMACPVESCDAIGWYPNKGDAVYIATDQDVVGDMYARGILLHELVHYVQQKMGSPVGENRCLTWKAREMQAYGIQYHWIRVNRVGVRTPAYNLRLAGYSRITCKDEENHIVTTE